MKIAFIGLGNMGGPMAHNLHKAGHEVRAFDLSQPARDKLAADGVPIATDAKAAVAGAEVVISMLPASQHVEALFLGRDGQPGLLASIAKGALVIDSSTIDVATAKQQLDSLSDKLHDERGRCGEALADREALRVLRDDLMAGHQYALQVLDADAMAAEAGIRYEPMLVAPDLGFEFGS